ncbi:hypothetical protein MJO29_015750 [Puccinia striiformis f. sp. tritici]|uniref:hypothetical protein n=1 Tax=Puccinia striiformis f. sp. tritici TaxID=168172 RepID=UPI002007D7BA|nr:hypothetical protein Pst134EA_029379 [Puccinia striiformis f. sp. tritici]KAI9614328.1 hypothetical protein H4Q26_009476 [Puccinia striiformis f. sp. tritici PST-130]KAH9441362.1 hypothetical protein Pst134EB_030030 [Puccinia striiformis f. sp. tritici]KAH9447340.1 hypothetical protein Pst134EA_029379 [Puccinia striiformis f. sp. tritici]KAI7936447.1 hypothetical protein MJO29_015750 [Puccinia striiformis f. sp. tritici]KAI9624185.1 hypothetical protein KEM48_009083 [Puccinia striiformis f.
MGIRVSCNQHWINPTETVIQTCRFKSAATNPSCASALRERSIAASLTAALALPQTEHRYGGSIALHHSQIP